MRDVYGCRRVTCTDAGACYEYGCRCVTCMDACMTISADPSLQCRIVFKVLRNILAESSDGRRWDRGDGGGGKCLEEGT